MEIFGRNLSLSRFFRPQAATLSDTEFWREIFGALRNAAGVNVTPLTALGVSTVFACCNVVSRSFSTLPLKLYRRLPGGGREEAVDHPMYRLLHDEPNEEMSSAQFRRAMQATLVLRQAAHALIVRDGFGVVKELRPIAPQDITATRSGPSGQSGPLVYRLRRADGSEQIVPRESILHLRGLSFDGITGADLVGTARECIGLAIVLQDNAARFFGNGSRPGGFLEHPGSLSDKAAARLKATFEARSKGPNKAHSISVLEEGLKYVANRMPNDEAQFLESRIQVAKELVQFFGIPPHKVGLLENATFSNIEEQSIEYVTDAILPWCVEWEQTLNLRLLRPEERASLYFEFTVDGLLRGDVATRFAAYAIGRQWGFLCVDEIRSKENLPPLPNEAGKVFLQPSNMVEAGSETVNTLNALRALREARRRSTSDQAAA